MPMFNDIFCDRYENKDECLRNANIVKRMLEDLELVNGLLLDRVLRKKWYPSENSPQGAWDHVAEDVTTIRRKWTSLNDSIVEREVEK